MGKEINTKQVLTVWGEELKDRVAKLSKKNIEPKLTIIRIGNRSDSSLYVNNKIKKAKELGIEVFLLELDENTTQYDLNIILKCMKHPTILQLPIPKHLNSEEALRYLNPKLDVDGLTVVQKGLLVDGSNEAMIPATAQGVVRLIESVTDIEGSKVVILSRSELIGKPLTQLILQKNGYPVVLHSKINKAKIHSEMTTADIVVTGCGRRAIFDSINFRSSFQTIIDCSMHIEEGIPGVGDLDKDDVMNYTHNTIASGYGHTGPATVMGLMNNVVKYYELNK